MNIFQTFSFENYHRDILVFTAERLIFSCYVVEPSLKIGVMERESQVFSTF
ncbi:hypothetical protein [Nostoc sp. TCL26-01]|uniref:hypothetical protein n=1 Tax=Nostoc sp. TCL26-01 TaxID=2576904 RepID=UPI0015BF1042|nr:hypothetical protein [Nostoc sp. TCL26-01]